MNQTLVLYSARSAVRSSGSLRLRCSFAFINPLTCMKLSRCVSSNSLCCSEAIIDIISRVVMWAFLPVASKGGNSVCLLIAKPFNVLLKPVFLLGFIRETWVQMLYWKAGSLFTIDKIWSLQPLKDVTSAFILHSRNKIPPSVPVTLKLIQQLWQKPFT